MGSLGFGEIALIAIVALLVFGPERLPELSRKAGVLMAKAREASRTFTDAIDSEFDEASAPLRSLKADMEATKDELTTAAGAVLDLDSVSLDSVSLDSVSLDSADLDVRDSSEDDSGEGNDASSDTPSSSNGGDSALQERTRE